MRIAFVNSHRSRIGGAETYLDTVMPALDAAGHRVSFLYMLSPAPGEQLIRLPLGIEHWCAAETGWERTIAALIKWRADIVYVHAMDDVAGIAAVIGCAPAVLFAHSYYGTCISGHKMFSAPRPVPCERIFGPRCFAHYYPHRCGGLDPLNMIRSYRDQLTRLHLMRRCAAILTASEHMRAELLRHGFAPEIVRAMTLPVAPAEPIEAPPNLSKIEHEPEPEPGRALRLLYVGRMTRLKGGPIMFDALAAAASVLQRPMKLTLAGDGTERSTWERKARRVTASNARIAIEFRGVLDGVSLDREMRSSDLLVIPSTWPEPFGLTGPEAGLRGLPAVGFSVGGIPEWLKDGINGRLAPGDPPTADGLARAIVDCVRDPAELARLGRGARDASLSDRFAIASHVDELLSIFERVVPPAPAVRAC
jgi:glycosyltransferase involved in cell wall biosynthesis